MGKHWEEHPGAVDDPRSISRACTFLPSIRTSISVSFGCGPHGASVSFTLSTILYVASLVFFHLWIGKNHLLEKIAVKKTFTEAH